MKPKKIAFIGLTLALAMILSFVESRIPPLVAIPGIKIGLPNLVIVFLLYRVGWKEAALVNVLRVALVSALFGNVQSFVFGIVGASVSLVGMSLLKKTDLFSCIAVSIVGGILHNVGQIVTACFWTETAQIAFYLPVLLASGMVAGAVIGLVSGLLVKRLEKLKL